MSTFALPSVLSSASSSLGLGLGLDEPTPAYAWTGVAVVAAVAATVAYAALGKGPYDEIPAVGGTDLISSYLAAFQFLKNGRAMVQAGYDKYKSGVFRIPQMNRWHIIVSDEKHIEELSKAPDDVLSVTAAFEEIFLGKYLLGPTIVSNQYHADVARGKLTRNLGTLFPDVQDEIVRAFEEYIPPSDGWSKVPAYNAVLQIVARASNRIFVGIPLCRDPEYISLNIRYTIDVMKARYLLMPFPEFLIPIAAGLLTNVPKSIRLGLNHLNPLVQERQRKIDEYGPDYPRSATFTHALFHLASRPEYIVPIREEIEAAIAEEGWTKVAMTRMLKLDSLFKESQRLNGLSALSVSRVALKDFTFSDGTHIPKGAMVSAAAWAKHYDDKLYTNGDIFDGFRFSDARAKNGQGTKNHFVATNPEYLSFGHGRHACPGRFFAANELKAMMAHILLTYDIKMENEGVRPEDQWFGINCAPDTKAEVLFKRRQT